MELIDEIDLITGYIQNTVQVVKPHNILTISHSTDMSQIDIHL